MGIQLLFCMQDTQYRHFFKAFSILSLGAWALINVGCSGEPVELDTVEAEESPTTSTSAKTSESASVGNSNRATPRQASMPANSSADVIKVVETPEGEKIHYAKMATVVGVEENRQMQRNLNFVRQKIQEGIALKREYDSTLDPDQRAELKKQLDQAEVELEEYNKKLIEFYRISATRNFVIVPERAQLYVQATQEEAQKLEEAGVLSEESSR